MPIALPVTSEHEVVSDETLHFEYPGSDIVLRSCDSHDFLVPKLYIINSSSESSVIRELVQSVFSTSGVADGGEQEPLPVVNLPEKGTTLCSLLTFIFPVDPTLPPTTECIMELLAVAQKYQMGSVLTHVRAAISRLDPPFIRPETALHDYFLAQKHGLHQEAVQAARVTLRLSMAIEDLDDKIEFMPGTYLRELWRYHERVRADLKSALLESHTHLTNEVKGIRCRLQSSRSIPPWFDNYVMSIAGAPHLFDIIEFENIRAQHLQNVFNSSSALCPCVGISSQTIRTSWAALTAVVHGTIEKVSRSCVSRGHHDNEYEHHRQIQL